MTEREKPGDGAVEKESERKDEEDREKPGDRAVEKESESPDKPLASEVAVTEGFRKRGLVQQMKDACDEVFEKEINSGPQLTKGYIMNKMKTNHILRKCSCYNSLVKKVTNYVNDNIRKRPTIDPSSLPERKDSVEDCMQTWSDSQKSGPVRTFWDDEDTKAIADAFKEFKIIPSNATKKTIFFRDEHLSEIWQREGKQRCFHKVKTVIRQRMREDKR